MNEMHQLIRLLRPYRWRIALSIFLATGTIAANVGLFGTSGYLIAAAALHPENVLLLWVPIVGVRFFGISRGIFRYLERLVAHDVTFRVLSDLRVAIFDRLAQLETRIWQHEKSAKMLSTVVSDVEQVQFFFLRILSPFAVAIFTGTAGYIWMARFDLQLANGFMCMYVLAGLMIPIGSTFISHRIGKYVVQKRTQLYEQSEQFLHFQVHWQLSGRKAEAFAQFTRTQTEYAHLLSRINRIQSITLAMMHWLSRVTMLLIIYYTIPLTHTGVIEPVLLPMLMLISFACFEAVLPLPAALQQWGAIEQAAQRIFNISKAKVNHSLESNVIPSTESTNGSIAFDNVSVRYANQARAALENIHFSLNKGEHLAIVGNSGAGKSTLLKALMRDLEVSAGSIQWNGHDLRSINKEELLRSIALVPQQVYLFHATVSENIRLGKPEATQAEIEQAAKQAQIHERIMQMPHGYDSYLGEFGNNLSGGERQRIGLARAILRNAEVYLFDEPLNGLDRATAIAFVHTVKEALQDCTFIWVTHRFEEIEQFDRIICLENGRIREKGTPAALEQQAGMFATLRRYDAHALR